MNKKILALLISLLVLFAQVQAGGNHNQDDYSDKNKENNEEQDDTTLQSGTDEEEPVEEEPVQEESVEEEPVEEEPVEEEIVEEEPVEEEPVEEGPTEEEPIEEEPIEEEPIEEEPTNEEEQNDEECLCHPSCICKKGSSICSKCKHETIGAVLDEHKKSCPCPAGYFTKSVKPSFECEQLLVPDTEGQSEEEGACARETQMKTKYVSLNTNCYYCVLEGISYVVSDVSLNFNSVSISKECKSYFRHTVQFLHPTLNSYADLDAKYIVEGENGSLKLKFPLIDVYHLTQATNVGETQISQQINLMSLLGSKDKVIKQIKWAICIYTNRDQVQIFQLDIDIQQTQQDCEDCVVIADLETIGEVYSDESFETKVEGTAQYFVGDYFYAKIRFVDSTYTKELKFVSLYYKNDLGMIYDFSSITVHAWKENGLTIALPLSEPSHPATIQVQMLIASLGDRFLQEGGEEEDKQKSNFSIDVDSKGDQQQEDENGDQKEASAGMMLFGLMNLIAAILLI